MTWPRDRVGEALAALAELAGLEPRPERAEVPADGQDVETWLVDAAHWIGIDAEPTAALYPDMPALVRGCGPALAEIDGAYVAVVGARGNRVEVLAPDGARTRIPVATLVAALRKSAEDKIAPEIERIVEATQIAAARRPRLRGALLAGDLEKVRIGGVTLLRRAIEAPARVVARDLRLIPRLARVALLHLAGYTLSIAGWWAIGSSVLAGHVDLGYASGWAVLIVTGLIARNFAQSMMGPLSVDVATAVRSRLFVGALRLETDQIRLAGMGVSVGRICEAQAFETLAVSGGFLAAFAMIELVVVAVMVAFGSAGWIHVGMLVAAMAAIIIGTRAYMKTRQQWTESRLAITGDLIELMNGHATRLAQQPSEDRHSVEDRGLTLYVRRSELLDRRIAWLRVSMPRAWLIAATLGLAPTLVFGTPSVPKLAIALGGMLFGASSLGKLGEAVISLVDARIAWRSIAPLIEASRIAPQVAPPTLSNAAVSPLQPLATVRGVSYRAPRSGHEVLRGCELEIARGDRVVLEGDSGSGKSTLASIVAGLRQPDSGLVLAGGLDRPTLGDSGWRRRVALVPQFHDNHMFYGSFAFNLMIARSWPTTVPDLEEALEICIELGLTALLRRMPSEIHQFVGETGWQLSHGEKNRVYVARALLSRAPLILLDESLGALDPDTMILVTECIEKRAIAALVIAHP
ncbi:MAG: ATP-binding cassette domain-containing protein [Kofleriaceae bacterium]